MRPLILTEQEAERLAEALTNPREPTPAIRETLKRSRPAPVLRWPPGT